MGGTARTSRGERGRNAGALSLIAILLLGGLTACSSTTAPTAGLPDTGPTLERFDSLMLSFMARHGIGAGALGIMRGGEVVYEEGFGWQDASHQTVLPDDALMRLASVTKPLTASAIRKLESRGQLALDDHAFNLGQEGGGILELVPFPMPGDPRLEEITVRDLLRHRGGWDRDIAGDLTYREIQIAGEMGVPSPPGRENTVRYILGRPLEHEPGSVYAYSNIGFLVLGLIVEEVTGTDHLEYIRSEILAPLGVPATELILGRTFPTDRDPREPWYDSNALSSNVFDPTGALVRAPDGGWHHEARVGQGGLVASTYALLEWLDDYIVSGDEIGAQRSGTEGAGWRRNHTGSLSGTNTLARQRGDGVNYVVLFNKRPSSSTSYSTLIRGEIDALLDGGTIRWN